MDGGVGGRSRKYPDGSHARSHAHPACMMMQTCGERDVAFAVFYPAGTSSVENMYDIRLGGNT